MNEQNLLQHTKNPPHNYWKRQNLVSVLLNANTRVIPYAMIVKDVCLQTDSKQCASCDCCQLVLYHMLWNKNLQVRAFDNQVNAKYNQKTEKSENSSIKPIIPATLAIIVSGICSQPSLINCISVFPNAKQYTRSTVTTTWNTHMRQLLDSCNLQLTLQKIRLMLWPRKN